MTEPPARAQPAEPARRVAERLHSVALHLMRRLRREDDALGVSAARLSALSVIGFGGPRTIGELAAAEQVTPPTITRLVAALEREGLVTRATDAADRRVTRVQATAKGMRVLERGRRRRTDRLAAQLRSLGPDELATLDRAAAILERLLQDARE